jgi:hypothetical protein
MPEDGNRVPKTGITIGTKVKMQKEQSDMEGRYLHFPVERSKSAVQICIHHTLFTGLSGIGPRRWTHMIIASCCTCTIVVNRIQIQTQWCDTKLRWRKVVLHLILWRENDMRGG